MKAVDSNLLTLLRKTSRFIVPIYQRVYSWGEPECEKLWDDIVRAGQTGSSGTHFTGSIVYIERDQGTSTAVEPNLIIDGQQRVTTVILVLAALAEHLESLPEDEQEVVEGFAPAKIRGLYLTNPYESGDSHFKLLLSKGDRDALKSIVMGSPIASGSDSESRVLQNYEFLKSKLDEPEADIEAVCRGLDKLVVVDVSLTRGVDDPQLVFESMNSTGKQLSHADLIRNFVLMDLPQMEQEKTYETFWFPMESQFSGDDEKRFDDFIRDFLTLKTGKTPRMGDIYDAFKSYAFEVEAEGVSREDLVSDLSRHAQWFVNMALGREQNSELAARFEEIEALKSSVVYPFLLRVYADHENGLLSLDDFVSILDIIISYVFRRNSCDIPTNSLGKTFMSLTKAVDEQNYLRSVAGRLVTLTGYRRFPSDEEFAASLCAEGDFYHWRPLKYLLGTIENHGNKEPISVANFTIEHIMPQNENLSPGWQMALGDSWREVHEHFLDMLGNLTLTGYNPEYSDKDFAEKRDMEGGFKDSPLRVNKGIGQLESWNADEIEARAERLAKSALEIWKRPILPDDELQEWAEQFSENRGFDWSALHSILEALPEGSWTSYYELAGAVGTSAQAVGNHITSCSDCTNAFRVLTWDGRLAEGFHWFDLDDDRDPVDVLVAEGVRFVDGQADKHQQFVADDLLALIDEIA